MHQAQVPVQINLEEIMALPVVLKSGKNYVSVVLDDELPFEELLVSIINKFRESEYFLGTEPFAIMIEGRELTDREKNIILDAIYEYTSVNISHLIENDVIKETIAEMQAYDDMHLSGKKGDNNCLFIKRDVIMKEKVFAPGNIVVYGDVKKGAIVKAGANIIILGALKGQALAGNDPVIKDPFIMANDFRPENFRIGPLVGNAPRAKKSVLKRHQPLPLIAEFTDGEIQIYSI